MKRHPALSNIDAETRQRILERAARERLYALMSDLSEEHWHAGWLNGTEYTLWKAIQQYPEPLHWGQRAIPLDTVADLYHLALAVGGWWVWGEDGAYFVSLGEWERLYAEGAAAGAAVRGL